MYLFKIRNFLKNLFSSSRLRKKFLRLFLIIGLIPLLLMGSASLYVVNQTHRIDVSTLEKQLADFKKTEIKKFIDDIIVKFQLRVGYEQYAEIEISQQQFIADEMIKENPALIEVAFINVYGKEVVKSQRDKNAEIILKDQSKSLKFINAMNGQDHFSSVSYMAKQPIISMSSPVYNQKNRIIAVLAGDIDLSFIQDRINESQLGNSGYVYVVDPNGTIIANSKKIDIGKNLISSLIVLDVLLGEKRMNPEQGVIYKSPWNERVIGSSFLIPNLNWGIIVEWPFNDAQKVIGLILTQLAQFSLLTLALIFVSASLAALNLIKPISSLKESAQIIGGGDFDHQIKIRTGDEIEELGHSLNKMAISLKELQELKEIKLRAQYLAESLKKEKELSQLKNQFITIMSHQLNTPLSIINWSLEAIKDPEATKQTIKESIFSIDSSRYDILMMVDKLLTLSEMGFRYQKTKSETADLKEITKQIIEEDKPRIDIKKLNIKLETKTDDVTAEIDVWAIKKVIEILLDNAILYSNNEGKIEIELSGDTNTLTFKIKDYGIGIPQKDQLKIFKEFSRANNATIKKNSASGLGLFIAKNFIDGHKGKIWFESEENQGATFYFTIPRKVKKED